MKKYFRIPAAALVSMALMASLSAYGSSSDDENENVAGEAAATSSKATPAPKLADKTFTVKGVSFKMIAVQGGTFQMGSEDGADDEKPVHQVTLSDYYIGETEVTQELWEAVMGKNPSGFVGRKLPVEYVSWNDCRSFIEKLNTLTGKTFRLPTEAEWEYAARGGQKSKGYKYSGSNEIREVAWCYYNSSEETHEVATKKPNELGIYDMTGNVQELCFSWLGDYTSEAQTNPTGPFISSLRAYRGGSWSCPAKFSRTTYRIPISPTRTADDIGLRLAM